MTITPLCVVGFHGIFAPAILMAVAGVSALFVSFNADMKVY
jgi:hypothetical protein